mmetsp:Transcript_1363/g.4348  ORF Transcript_1363/g.4348 Transcript_1363/m.4348 type:complete len:277 (+) Transcript_1363:1990-2820(+)
MRSCASAREIALSQSPCACRSSLSRSWRPEASYILSASCNCPSCTASTPAHVSASAPPSIASRRARAPLACPMCPRQTSATSMRRVCTHMRAMFSQTEAALIFFTARCASSISPTVKWYENAMSAWLVAASISPSGIPANSRSRIRCTSPASPPLPACSSPAVSSAWEAPVVMRYRWGTTMPSRPSTSASLPVWSLSPPPPVLSAAGAASAWGETESRTLRPCSGVEKRVVASSFGAPAGAAGDGLVSTASSLVSAPSHEGRAGSRCAGPKSCACT